MGSRASAPSVPTKSAPTGTFSNDDSRDSSFSFVKYHFRLMPPSDEKLPFLSSIFKKSQFLSTNSMLNNPKYDSCPILNPTFPSLGFLLPSGRGQPTLNDEVKIKGLKKQL